MSETERHPVILSPSLLASDFSRLAEELAKLEDAGLSWVHWDAMDGDFVPNLTLGPQILGACRKKSNLFFDVHLMIREPDRLLKDFIEAGADLVCVHAEACVHLERTVSEIARLGALPAVALNPHTPLEMVEYLLPQLRMVLIMSVNPGFGGQRFIPFSLDKVERLAAMIRRRGLSVLIQVDGGVTPDNAGELVRRGADVLVAGSAFFSFRSYKTRHQAFLKAAVEGRAAGEAPRHPAAGKRPVQGPREEAFSRLSRAGGA